MLARYEPGVDQSRTSWTSLTVASTPPYQVTNPPFPFARQERVGASVGPASKRSTVAETERPSM